MITAIYAVLITSSFLYLPLFPHEEFETPKAFALISFACLSLLLIPYKRLLKDKVALSLLLFFCSCIASGIFSLDPYTSVFGNFKMPNGILVYGSYLVFYLNASQNLNTYITRINIIRILCFASFLIALYAVMQATGHDFKQWTNITEEYGYIRPPSTLGHPNFMAAYLAMTLPYIMYLFDFSRIKAEKIFALISFFISIAALFFSQSRGMFWAALISMAIYFGIRKISIKQIAIIAATTLFIGFISINTSSIFKRGFLSKSSQLLSIGKPRIEYIKASIRIFKKYPFLGSGTDTFETAFQNQRTPYYWQLEPRGSPHRAHNEFFNVLATQGIFGILAVFLLMISIIFKMQNSLYLSSFSIPAIASIAAFFIQDISSFHCIATCILLLISICFLDKLEMRQR